MEQILTARDDLVPIDRPVVLALGAFDGIHIGHQAVIISAKNEAKRLNAAAVVYSFWPHPSVILNRPKKLILTREQKINRLTIMSVDYFVEQCFTEMFSEIRAKSFIGVLQKKFSQLVGVCVGENFKFGQGCEGDPWMLKEESRFFDVKIQSSISFENQRVSSSNIRKCLTDGYIDRVNRMLGYPYSISGITRKGRGIAQKLGYPTLNVYFTNDLLLKFGVYLVRYRFNDKGEYMWGVANFGIRPTFIEMAQEVTLEVHSLLPVFFQARDIPIEIQFWSYIREEKRFTSQILLVEQIRHDIKIAKNRISRFFIGNDN
ncbi:MAG: riboflavin biosynthesis protein RibF [Puniceicoccales bacterium]|jgi:riboflavin kinase/FMN adenylyltransferase|nr:riboflavin biosynthesis protein RibF [Puniceicoccales bacterium]